MRDDDPQRSTDDAAEPDWVDSPGFDERFVPDPDRVAALRAIADDIRGDTSERTQLAAILYRVSDLYDESEDTTPEEIYRNVKHILDVKEVGGLRKNR